MRPVVSVIIPIYNSEKYVVQCVESVLNQTLENIEIICVNDGSSDSSLELLKKLEKKDRRVVLVSQDNQGLSGARNTGMQYAQGQYMYFLDSDDWIEEIALDYMVQIADTKNYDVVMASYIKEFGDHSATVKIFNNSGEMELGGVIRRLIGPINQKLKSPELVDLPVSAWGQLFKTEKVKYIQFVDTKKIGTEDLLFQIMTYGQCSSFYYIDRPFYHYRRSDYGTLTTKYMPEKFERWQRLYCIIEKIIADRNYDGVYREAFNHRVCYSMIGLGLNEILSNEGCWAQSKSIKRILDSDRYAKAYKEIDLKILPIHWKVFFGLCKYRQTFALVMMLHIIEFLRKKVF